MNYFFENVIIEPEEESTLDMPTTKSLFNMNTTSYQTLINPQNLNYFYEKFKSGDIASIQKKFSVSNGNYLTEDQVKGLYKYLLDIVDKQVNKGQTQSTQS